MRRVTARYNWDRLRVSFWFAPAVTALGAMLLAWTMYWIDGLIPNEVLQNSRFVLSGSVDELRSALLNQAGTTLATAGVVFTLLTLPLSTVVAQYGSRLLRVFLSDRTTQLVLAMFAGTFVYCIAGALSIPPASVQPEGPQLTATVGLYLMLATFASLVILVQHISTMLQAPKIAAMAGAELLDLVIAEAPHEVTSSDDQGRMGADTTAALDDTQGFPVRALESGYIQAIDPEYMLTLARDENLVIRLLHKPGHFVTRGMVFALVWPQSRVDEKLEEQLGKAIRIGNQRTPTQDVECAVNQLVEMAVRAMSPAINDPFTAITCLDHLGNGLAQFVQQGGESLNTYDKSGQLRLVFEPVTFSELLSAAFDMLRHASCDNATVLLHMLTVINTIGQVTKSPEARQKLLRHVCLIQSESQAGTLIEEDRQMIRLCSEVLQEELKCESG
jgi:uncharacterized membrane protein